MDKYIRGAHVPMRARYWVGSTLTDVDTYTVGIMDKSGQLVITANTAMSHPATGTYTYDYASASTDTLGKYTADATLTKDSIVHIVRYEFELIGEVV